MVLEEPLHLSLPILPKVMEEEVQEIMLDFSTSLKAQSMSFKHTLYYVRGYISAKKKTLNG
jgi:hypothetical protein